MALISLLRDDTVNLLCDNPIITKEELSAFERCIDMGDQLGRLLAGIESRSMQSEQRGFELGLQQGREQGYANEQARLAEHILTLSASYQQKINAAEIGDLVMAIVRKVAGEIGAPRFVSALVGNALRELNADHAVVVKIHPANETAVRNSLSLSSAPSVGDDSEQTETMSAVDKPPLIVTIQSDASLDEFDCIIETEFGDVLAGLAEQLASLENYVVAEIRDQSDR